MDLAFPRFGDAPQISNWNSKKLESSLGLFCVRFGKSRRRYDKNLKLGFCFTKVEFSDIRNFLKISNKPHLALRPVEM